MPASGDVGILQIVGTTFVVLVAICFSHFVTQSRSLTILYEWAKANGYRLVAHQRRWLAKGPFTFTTSKGQVVFRITVETRDGRMRRGWARCGSWFLGSFSSAVRVEWDADSIGFPVIQAKVQPEHADRKQSH